MEDTENAGFDGLGKYNSVRWLNLWVESVYTIFVSYIDADFLMRLVLCPAKAFEMKYDELLNL